MVSITDIAARLGVSRTTVSLVLNNRSDQLRISDATRSRILSTAGEMGYRVNALARAASTGNSRVLGFLTTAPDEGPSARILTGAIDEATRQGFFVKVLRIHNDSALDDDALERCLEMRLGALFCVYLSGSGVQVLRDALEPHSVPLAVVDDVDTPQNCGLHILSDYESGMDAAVDHLFALGHRRIGLLMGLSEQELGARQRRHAFERAMALHQLTVVPDWVRAGDWGPNETDAVAREVLSLSPAPTAIIAGTDFTGLAVIRAARGLGLRVPDDVSILGFGDARIGDWADPPMAVVAQPFAAMGQMAVRHLLERLPQKEMPWSDPAREIRLPTELILRASTARVSQTNTQP
ncbi:catabolite control protein A [Abditibacteriota bacterium]|nr:catabolite control protein A [Abditibacteriota bacterium]